MFESLSINKTKYGDRMRHIGNYDSGEKAAVDYARAFLKIMPDNKQHCVYWTVHKSRQ